MSCGVVAGVSMWPSVALKASQSTVAVHGADTVVGPANKQSRVLKKFILLLFGAFILSSFTFSTVPLLITAMEVCCLPVIAIRLFR